MGDILSELGKAIDGGNILAVLVGALIMLPMIWAVWKNKSGG